MDNMLDLEIIKTARNLETINEYVKKGYLPLIRKIIHSAEIGYNICVYKNKYSGEIIERKADAWLGDLKMDDFEKIIDQIHVYPYHFNSPFAAYLIPNYLFIGQKVFLEDLIEDFIGTRIQSKFGSSTERLPSAQAIWNGKDIVILEKMISTKKILCD